MGTWNEVVPYQLDRTSEKNTLYKITHGKLQKVFFDLIANLWLADKWRQNNGSSREYIYFLGRHRSFLSFHIGFKNKHDLDFKRSDN